MKVTLMVNWEEKEILTVEEFDERVKASAIEEIQDDDEVYDAYLDEYLDRNYTKMELFNALSGSEAEREKILSDIRSGVAEAVYDWVKKVISDNFHDITIKV